MVMGQQVPHDGRGEVTEAVGNDVRLQGLQEDAFGHGVLQQPRVQLVEEQLAAETQDWLVDRFCRTGPDRSGQDRPGQIMTD